ncbi:CitMHS family transporter [Saccharopolyspora gloriosae]|uniref:CitMHS family citrate-Mg2+:H+ or citrate-Ca2+:H+ symporter n=1 Tax=Saccharopolyspora gloriosae TaxID=455344 RepID=A0A840NFP0_9PSEU|nr:citrate:proton symporter [Saccharopolyspora gloriosae]MBB5068905.1 CitMHS family citrate-Mg2+:H+ or citrate-Ca2+:H+ symporter [Saccharopolyspora gloriosae]
MLAVLGFGTLGVFMALVMRRYATAFVAIMATPVFFGVAAGFGGDLDEMMLNGLEIVAPTAILLLFAVLYFGVMMDARLFDPISRMIIRVSKGDPVRICVGTAVLALLVALDGDGTTSYMIICSAFLPIYRRLGINPLVIATIATMALGTISGTTPWGGAATRGISVLHLDSTDYFVHMIGPMVLTSLTIVAIAWMLGRDQRKRIDRSVIDEFAAEIAAQDRGDADRTWRTWFNAGLTVLLLVLLVAGVAEPVNLFMLAFVIALLVNHPRLADQGEVIKKHAGNAVPVVMLVLGAGIFTGIMTDTGMTEAMADALLAVVPDSLGNLIPLFTAVIGLPLSFFMSNDAYFFGVLPVLAESAGHYGIAPVEIARAGAIGQMMHSIGPASAPLWVLLGLIKRDLGDFQRFAVLWVLLASLAYIAFAVLTGAISVA